ncbi:ash family protein [Gallibacterium salpingitidis]|uniref:ash family protein n=1 Tax=Gallibacterium salpingitidis TaxID=505341 RepID=UPI0009EDA5E0|nr:ash family protein [Gallibacterium salpingitidis]
MNKFYCSSHSNISKIKNELFSSLVLFTANPILSYFNNAFAKSKAEPGNSNDISLAHNTPLNACFFMRSTRTPQRKAGNRLFNQSMVTCNGKGFALCCVPVIAVFQPVTRYRPKAWKLLAVTSKNLFTGVTAMIYKFLLLGKKRLKITILANSEQEARQYLQLSRNAVCIARLNAKGVSYA